MRRSISRALFVLILAASGFAVLLLVASSMRIAYAQVRPGRGGGGGAGVSLLATWPPSTDQAGHIALGGNLGIGQVGNKIGGPGGSFRPLAGSHGGIGLYPTDFNTNQTATSGHPYEIFGSTSSSPIWDFFWTTGTLGGNGQLNTFQCTLNTPCVITTNGSYVIGAATNAPAIVNSPGAVASGDLFDVDNAGAKKFGVSFDGTITAAVPIPQTSGGTGSGATTCAAGQFLTSNGTAYSCAALPAGSAIVSVSLTLSATNVSGSLCVFGTPTVAPAGVTVGMGCVMNFVGQLSTACSGVTCPTMSCTTFAGSGANLGQTMYETRFCNTGTNTDTAPAGNYVLHFLPP